MRALAAFLAALLGLGPAAAAEPVRIVFVNPGFHDESFWATYGGLMQAAAERYGWAVDVRYAERDSVRMAQIAEAALNDARKPDYLVMVDEMPVLGPILRSADYAGVETLVVNVSLGEAERAATGAPRQRLRHWLGSIVPDNRQAGLLIAEQALAGLPKEARLLEFHGNHENLADRERIEGLRGFLAQEKRPAPVYEIEAHWRRGDAERQMAEILGFDRRLDAVWAGNDEMALGVLAAYGDTGPLPRISGVLSSKDGVEALAAGRLAPLPAGDITLGACAVVLLHEYRAGRDFAAGGDADLTLPVFEPVTSEQAPAWRRIFDPAARAGLPFERWEAPGPGRCRPSTVLGS